MTNHPDESSRRPRRSALVALVALAAVTAACADDGPPQSAPAAQAVAPPVTADAPPPETTAAPATDTAMAGSTPVGVGEPVLVLSRDNTFTPEVIEVPVGTEVVWRNGGRTEHDLYPVDSSLGWGVAPEDFPPGSTFSHVFTEPGEYPYYCTIHGTTTRGMVGTVIVTG